MTADHDTTRIVRSWLEEGPTRLPDRVLDHVLGQVPATRQRRSWWPARRDSHMNTTLRIALVAAVAIIAIIAASFAGVGRQPVPSPSPTPLPSAAALPIGSLVPGRYAWMWPGGQLSFTVPSGWSGVGDGQIVKHVGEVSEFGLSPALPGPRYAVSHVYRDACQSEGTLTAIGPGVDELLAALDAQRSTDAVITDLVIGGRPGHRVDLSLSPSTDRSACRHGRDGPAQIWADPAENNYFAFPLGWPGATAYVVDVDGERMVFISGAPERGISEADQAELDALIASMAFEPRD